MKVKRKKTPKVNLCSVELYLERTIEQAMQTECIRKPISWALYQTWKWADANEEEREVNAMEVEE